MFTFLTLEKEAFGLDISDLSLKIVKLKKKGKFLRLASFNQLDIKPGIIQKGIIKDEDTLAKIIRAACKSVKGEKLNTKYVIASLPEEKSFLQVIQMPKMGDEELKQAVLFEAENYIPLPINEVYLDFQIITPIQNHHNHLDVLIVAMPKKIVTSYVSCFKKAGLVPLALEIESEAIARALIENETSASPIALVDFGKNSTDVIVFSGRSIRLTHSIPISSDQLTAAISKSLGIDSKKAEKVKRQVDLMNQKPDARSRKVTEALNPILEDLMAQIKKYINFYQDHDSEEHASFEIKIAKVFLCGGGANLKGLPEFTSQKLGIPAELKNFWVHFSGRQLNDEFNKDFLSFSTALGLALLGIKK